MLPEVGHYMLINFSASSFLLPYAIFPFVGSTNKESLSLIALAASCVGYWGTCVL